MSVESLINGKGTTCDVYTVTDTQDDIGGNVAGETLRLDDQQCFIDELTVTEQVFSGRYGEISTHRFFFVSGTTINLTDVFKIGTDSYDVTAVVDPHRFGHHVEVLTKLRV